MIDFDLQGQVLYLTGGGSGIGRAIALMGGRGGMKVAVADAVGERAEQVAAEVRAMGVPALALTLDVHDADGCAQAVDTIEDKLGAINGMVACAGVSPPGRAEDLSDEAWTRSIDVNLTGMFRSVQPVGKRMIRRQHGAIVLISSINGLGGHAGRIGYVASKHGIAAAMNRSPKTSPQAPKLWLLVKIIGPRS